MTKAEPVLKLSRGIVPNLVTDLVAGLKFEDQQKQFKEWKELNERTDFDIALGEYLYKTEEKWIKFTVTAD